MARDLFWEMKQTAAATTIQGFARLIIACNRVVELLERVPRGETFDWVDAIANELPIQMLATLFAIPQEDRRKLLRWSNVMTGFDDI